MTLQEKIVRSLGRGVSVRETEFNGKPAIEIRHPAGAVFTLYAEAARVQIRHLDAYRAAVDARKVLLDERTAGKGEIDLWRLNRMHDMAASPGKRLAWKEIDRFAALSGFRLVERAAPKKEATG